MCTPTSIAMMQGGGALTSAAGALYGAQAQQSQLEGRARLGEINARMADDAARGVLYAGQKQAEAAKLRAAQVKGSQKAAFAANGVDLGVGSAARVLTDTDALGEMDANTIEANAIRSAWGYTTQAVNMRNDALFSEAAADGISPGTAAFTSLIGGSTQVAAGWYSLARKGG